MNEKLVSVIVPVYNVERYLARCVGSILAQTYHDLEIILVDDGSTDISPEICDEYKKKDDRIRVYHQKNGGLSAARNTGIDMASGEYIVFVDSDDYIHPQMIECLHKGISDNHVMMSMCGFKMVSSENVEVGSGNIKSEFIIHNNIEILNWIYDANVNRSIMATIACDKMYHRDLFSNCRFPVGKLFEDNYTSPRLIHEAGLIAVNEEPMYYYFQREGSISNTRNTMKALCDAYDAAEYVRTFMVSLENEQLILKSSLSELKCFYLFNRNYSELHDSETKKYARNTYKKLYKQYVRNEVSLNWRLRYGLMRYVPKIYNVVLGIIVSFRESIKHE